MCLRLSRAIERWNDYQLTDTEIKTVALRFRRKQLGFIKGPRSALLISGALAVLLIGLLMWTSNEGARPSTSGSIFFYCAAGIKPPVHAAAEKYEQEYGIKIDLQYGGSGTLLSSLQVAQIGDIYLAADDSYIRIATEKGLAAESIPLAYLKPVIAVQKGNGKNIKGIADLLREDVSVALANPDAASVGKAVKKTLTKSGQWEKLKAATKVFKPTVMDVANDIRLGVVDAGILWDATVNQYTDHLESVPVPIFENNRKQVTVTILKSSKQPTAALRFARYLGARDRGLLEFKKRGYVPVEGDVWSERPNLMLFSGAMLRLAIDQSINRFEEREGCEVTRIYNGCGILVSQMKTGERPDAYFSCDISFMRDVKNLFHESEDISSNQMVLLVTKGNPKGIRELKDLTKPNLKVGMAHPEKSALGLLTVRMMKKAGVYEEFMNTRNLVVDSATGDFLVNQIRTGSLDAVIVYRSNAVNVLEHLEVIPIDLPTAFAVQPYAVGRNSDHKYLMGRLLEAVKSAESKERFLSVGFKWEAN